MSNGRFSGSVLLIASAIAALGVACGPATPAEDVDPLIADPPPQDGPPAAVDNPDLDRGIAEIEKENWKGAEPHLLKAIDADPRSAPAAFYLAIAYEKTGESKKAEDAYRRALTLDSQLVEAAQNLAALYLDSPPRPDDAIPILQRALKVVPDDPSLQQNLAYAFGLKGNVDMATKLYEKVLAKKDDPNVRFAYGAMYFENKQPEKAVKQLTMVVSASSDPPLLATIGRMLGFAKDFKGCVTALDKAIVGEGTNAELYVRRGTCKHELKDEAAAQKDYEKAIEVQPEFAAGHYYLGLSQIAQKKPQTGKRALEKAATLGKGTKIGELAEEKLALLKQGKLK